MKRLTDMEVLGYVVQMIYFLACWQLEAAKIFLLVS
jgi:hypothetical protein